MKKFITELKQLEGCEIVSIGNRDLHYPKELSLLLRKDGEEFRAILSIDSGYYDDNPSLELFDANNKVLSLYDSYMLGLISSEEYIAEKTKIKKGFVEQMWALRKTKGLS